jgi:monoamine oxidase
MNARTVFLRRILHTFRNAGEIQPDGGRMRRREWLQMASLAGAGALTSCAGLKGGGDASDAGEGAVAIVGAGVAGLTAAWRLHQRGVAVHLYEGSQRTGGRMWTKRRFNEDGMFCEIGGELVDSGHTALRRLAAEIGVGIQSLKTGHATGTEYYLIEGRRYTDADLLPAFAPLARRIAGDAAGLYTADGDFTDKARAFDRMRLSDYLRDAGRATGAAPWLMQMLDVAYTTEYGRHTNEQSAMNFIDMISPDTSDGFKIYGDSDEAYRVAGGSGSLPEELTRRLTGRIEIHHGHRLTEISDDGQRLALTFAAGRSEKTVRYRKVICALPFTMLRRVDGVRSLALSSAKHRAIQQLGYGANAKAMFGFRERFWRGLSPVSNGGAFSDSLFEAWETSQGQSGVRGILTCYIGGRAAQRFSSGSAPRYLDELERCFPGAKAAHDGHAASMDWTHFEFSRGSFSSTGVGQYCGMISDCATPELGGRLIFAGEHTSEASPGYMNGGVDSGERAAREVTARLRS